MYDKGDKVSTPDGLGTVVYKRMKAPDYSKVEVYSVRIDSKCNTTNYSGTIYLAKDVGPSDYEQCGDCGYDHEYEYTEAHKYHNVNKGSYE
mgnify:CR=1 FL=1